MGVIEWLRQLQVSDFRFAPSETPLASWWALAVIPIYLATVWALKHHVKSRGKPYDLNTVVIAHNCLLSAGSGLLFLALLRELVWMASVSSALDVFCDARGRWTSGPVYFLYYVNYLFKFVELFDTCLLALRGKPTPFLHVYHHAATLVLCWSQLHAKTCMQWVVIIINLLVHVVMYLYYALHALKIDVWWKKYLTMTQIVQFVVALVACAVGLGSKMLHDFGYAKFPPCWGEYAPSFFGIAILLSYLALFVKLYNDHYAPKPPKEAPKSS